MRKLVISSRADRRHAYAQQWLRDASRGDRNGDHGSRGGGAGRILLLAPTRGAADDFLRAGHREHGGLLGVHRLTLGQLAWEMASTRLAEAGLARLGGLGGEAMAALATANASESGELKRLASVAEMPGFPRALTATLRELRQAGLEPDELDSGQASLRDLSVLLSHYRRELERWRLVDRAQLFEVATECLVDGNSHWHGAASLWLDLPVRSRLEQRLLHQLARVCGSVLMTAVSADGESVEAGREVLEASVEDLDAAASSADRYDPASGREPLAASSSALERVQSYVFASEIAEVPDQHPEQGLAFFSASGEGQECVEIARQIRDLAAEGVRFDDMAIFVRQPFVYLPLVEDGLKRAAIPAFFSRGTSRPDPTGRAFLALLDCAAENLSASRFAEYLSLGQVPELREDARPPEREVPWVEPIGEQLVLKTLEEAGESTSATKGRTDRTDRTDGTDGAGSADPASSDPTASAEERGPAIAGSLATPAHWERLLVDAAVVGGVERWQRRLDGLLAELSRRAREVGDEEPLRRAAIERDRERLHCLRGFALPVVEKLAALPQREPWGVWLRCLEELAMLALRRPESVLGLLAELRPLREVGPIHLQQVQQVLGERLSFLRRQPPRRRYGRVFVGTTDEAAGRSFAVVFLPGLAEGLFPRRTSEDPLLLDPERIALNGGSQGAGLLTQDLRLRRERLLLHTVAGAARDRLVVSYPRVDTVRGRARVPSIYALEILRAAEGRVPDLKSLASRAAEASASRIGWPAPEERESAIDDAEYDLALLQDCLRRPPGQARGTGRFLLFTNEHLKRSLHARARRWRRPWTYADGLVASSDFETNSVETRDLLSAQIPKNRSFSPTALQHYSACPYRFFLQAVMRLRPREDPAGFEQLDPLTRGSIFHAMQFELQNELKRADMLPVSDKNLDRVVEIADRVIDRCIADFQEELAPAIPRVWDSEVENLRNDLRGWLRHGVQQPGGWRPLHFELAFGLPPSRERDPSSVEHPVELEGGALLRGAIDLVEIDGSGSRLRVTDHKTGRARRERELVIGGGTVLQPLIYALAAEQLLAQPDQQVVSGRLFFCTQKGEFSELEVPLNPEGREAVEGVLLEIEKALKKGFLPAAPAEGACRWCDYRSVCGPYEETRVKVKDGSRLKSLRELRAHR